MSKTYTVWLVVLLLLCAQAARAAGTAFSADVTVTRDNKTVQGKVYVDADKMRAEIGDRVTIFRTDRRTGTALMPSSKGYMNAGLRVSDAAEVDVFGAGAVLTADGTETINGQTCDKLNQTYIGRPVGTLYRTKAGTPVRYVSTVGHSQVDYSNVKMGPQPASLFEVPADYRKFGL